MPRVSKLSDYATHSPSFSSHVRHTITKTHITMRVFTKEVHTGSMRNTLPILKKQLPTILQSTCFNEGNIPFRVEVTRTELGHLFEHILLEYLCQLKLLSGSEEAVFSGTTDWNWNKYPRGTFQITVSVGKEDRDIFPQAFEKTSQLFETIIQKHLYSTHVMNSFYEKEAAITLPLSSLMK